MATNWTITGLRFARLRVAYGLHDFKDHGIAVSVFQQQVVRGNTLIAPVMGLAQGRIVSISRGSPPPKLR